MRRITAIHPEHESEQRYIEHAHERLEQARATATALHRIVEVEPTGGTHQARYERDVIHDTVANRLAQLELGDASLVFGRIDQADETDDGSYYIGRVAVWDDDQDPVVVDWRAPVAEAFFRATGPAPMGLARRRHFATRGRTLIGIEDEYFGEAATEGTWLKGEQSLVAALESARTGRLGDIVATIQAEQDEIIRAPLPGVLIVQGGPGTGKTVVALHRAAYLLYTHRFPLEGQGVLVVGPNRVFLTYIEQVLPALGESGVELAVLGDLIDSVRVQGTDAAVAARVKGDIRMVEVIQQAVRDRQRALRADLVIGYGVQRLRLDVATSRGIVRTARGRSRTHNAGRRVVEELVFEALAESGRRQVDADDVRDRLAGTIELREALEWMWPVLTPAQLLHDLFGSKPLLRSAGRNVLDDAEVAALARPRSASADDVVWTTSDVPLLDEARATLGSRRRGRRPEPVRTYGHIVIDEAQDLSPMQLRMIGRRSLSGSMTLVGDIAQATGPWAHDSWEEILEHLPQRREPRSAELTVGYRLPGPTMEVARRVLARAAPQLTPPVPVRASGDPPRFVAVEPDPGDCAVEALGQVVARVVREELAAVGSGNVAVICADGLADGVSAALDGLGVDHGRAYAGALERAVSVVPVGLVKGLEVDAAVVVEPHRIVGHDERGLRSLYVAVTRATQRLTVVHTEPLAAYLRP